MRSLRPFGAWRLRATLQTRICLAALALLVLSLAVTAAVIGIRSSRQAEASTRALARSGALDAAGALENVFRPHLASVLELASIARRTTEARRPPSREQLDDMVKGFLSDHPDVLSAGFIWEPDAPDGRDAAYAGRSPLYDETGRYKVLWHRTPDGTLAGQSLPLTGDANDWYELPRRAGKVLFMEPYAYPMEGQEILAASFVVPILVEGKFKGVVFADFSLAQLGKILAGVHSVAGADTALVSNGGLYASHPDTALLQKPAQDIPRDGLQAVQEGRAFDYEDARGLVHLLQPLTVHPDVPPWAVKVSFPKAIATQAARDLTRSALITAAACAAIAAVLLLGLLHRLMAPLRDLSEAMSGVSSGEADLGVQLNDRGHDELAAIAGGFNRFVGKVNRSLWHIRDASASMLVAASEIASGNNDLSARTESAASSLQQTASSMKSLTDHVEQTARAAERVSQLADGASAVAGRGGDLVERVVDSMADIHQNSRRVAQITTVIDEMAFQINLLAVNASVEAARAGEHGRGFAVVAGEVRMLAQRSAEAAKEIKALVQASVDRVDQGADLVKRTGQTMRDVVNAVQTLTTLIGDIRQATSDQSRSLQHIHGAVAHLDRSTQQNAALVEQGLAAAESLREQSQGLAHVAASFKLGPDVSQIATA